MIKILSYKLNSRIITRIGCIIILSAIILQIIQKRYISAIYNILLCITTCLIALILKMKTPNKNNIMFKSFSLAIYIFSVIGLFIWPYSSTVFLIVLLIVPLFSHEIINLPNTFFIKITIMSILGLILYRIAISLNILRYPFPTTIKPHAPIISMCFDYTAILILFVATIIYIQKLIIQDQKLKKLTEPYNNKKQLTNKLNNTNKELNSLMMFSLHHIKKNITSQSLLSQINKLFNIRDEREFKKIMLTDLPLIAHQLNHILSPNTKINIKIDPYIVKNIPSKLMLYSYEIINHIIVEILINSIKYADTAIISINLLKDNKLQIKVEAKAKNSIDKLLKSKSVYTTLKILSERINLIYHENIIYTQIKNKKNYQLTTTINLQKFRIKK